MRRSSAPFGASVFGKLDWRDVSQVTSTIKKDRMVQRELSFSIDLIANANFSCALFLRTCSNGERTEKKNLAARGVLLTEKATSDLE